MKTRRLFQVKNGCKNVKNQHDKNGRTGLWITSIELLLITKR